MMEARVLRRQKGAASIGLREKRSQHVEATRTNKCEAKTSEDVSKCV